MIRKICLTSKFITSQPRLQTISIHIANHTMKFGQWYRNIFLRKLCRKWGRETCSRPLFILWKSLIWDESKWSATQFRYISIALNLPYNKTKLYKTLDHWSRDMLNFNFSEKDLGLVSPPHFVNDFLRKMFLMFGKKFQILLSDGLFFSRYWTICILQLLVNQAVTS